MMRWGWTIAAAVVCLGGCGGAGGGDKPTLPGPTVTIDPTRSIHLRAAFDDDPTAYVGRFVPDRLKAEEIDENSAAQTRCSEFFSTKIVNTNQQMDEVVFTSNKAAASIGVKAIASASGSHASEGRMRIKYTLTKKIQTTVKDPAGLDRCCKGQADQCTSKVIGEFLMGTGEVYQFYGKQDDVSASSLAPQVSGSLDYKDSIAWKKVNSFKDMYFAFLTTATSVTAGTPEIDASCGWCDNLPSSLDGKYFCGVSPDVVSEATARDKAMQNAREQVVKFLGEYLSTQSSSVASSVKGYLEDTQTVNAAASGVASQVKDQKWCKPERTESPNGNLFKSRVLAFFPNGETKAAARATLEAVVRTRKAEGKLSPDEEKQLRTMIDGIK